MSDTKYEPGEVLPLEGKYYGTRVDIGHTTVTVWDHTGNSRPSDRELESYGIADWGAATREQRFDVTCDSHYETQEDYDLALLIAAAPRLAAALKLMLALVYQLVPEAVSEADLPELVAVKQAEDALREAGADDA